jgi:hypothetical protein
MLGYNSRIQDVSRPKLWEFSRANQAQHVAISDQQFGVFTGFLNTFTEYSKGGSRFNLG